VNRLAPWLLAAVALAGCAKNTSRPTAKMNGPQGVAVYQGYGADQPGVLRSLVAVANTRGDDLRIIDAVTDKVMAGPTVVGALSVPTQPLPSLIAAGSLHDQSTAGANVLKADLLVVAPRGLVLDTAGTFGAVIQSVVTWDAQTRVQQTIELSSVVPDSALTALVVVPVFESDGLGGWRQAANQARVLASTTDGALVSILATRDPADAKDPIVLGLPEKQLLGFTCLDLAATADGTRIYAATLDPIPGPGGELGVAEFDNTVATGPMPARALPARAGTTRVATLLVAPFLANAPSLDQNDTFGDPPQPRVYAAIDPTSCGRDRAMPCGIAVIDPVAGGLAADPKSELPYQLPIQIEGEVISMAATLPPKVSERDGFLKIDPGNGALYTKAFMAVASTTGQIYMVDLSRYGVGNAISPLNGGSQTRAYTGISGVPDPASAAIGIWYEGVSTTGVRLVEVLFDTLAPAGVTVTPGYTRSETINITYQGYLPGLRDKPAVAHVTSGTPDWIALQEATGLTAPGSSPWRNVVRVYDPRVAIQPGDPVVLDGLPSGLCPDGKFEMRVTGLLPPDPVQYPGGALAVEPLHTPPEPGWLCLPSGTGTAISASLRVSGLVVVGSQSGYMGRPSIVYQTPEFAQPFELRYENEDLLSCPIMPDRPEDWPPPAAAVTACEADVTACRSTCERLVLARRARRLYYMTDACPPKSTPLGVTCLARWDAIFHLQFPMPLGPVLAFKVGVTSPDIKSSLWRDAYLQFSTGGGFTPGSRVPYSGQTQVGPVMPGGMVFHDRSAVTGLPADSVHGFAAYVDNLVLDFSPTATAVSTATIR
jgi:hypothetical protein